MVVHIGNFRKHGQTANRESDALTLLSLCVIRGDLRYDYSDALYIIARYAMPYPHVPFLFEFNGDLL